MKKIYTLALALVGAASFGQSVVITKVIDGTLPIDGCSGTGGTSNPKIVELYVSGTLDLNNYRVQTESNGLSSSGTLSWNDGLFLYTFGEVSNSFLYLVNLPQAEEGQTQLTEIQTFLEMYPDIPAEKIMFSTYAPNMNGNDAIRIAIYNGDTLESVVDQFGNPSDIPYDTDSSNDYDAAWAYQDSYVARVNNTPANGGNFVNASFTYGGNNLLDGISCSDFATTVNLGGYTLSNKSFGEIAGLTMYPNPVTGSVLNISSDANTVKTVAIYDVLGKQVVNTTTANGTVNVGGLTAGVYIVKINEEGKTATRKLVVR